MPSTNAIQKQILDGAQIRIDKQSEIPVHKQISVWRANVDTAWKNCATASRSDLRHSRIVS